MKRRLALLGFMLLAALPAPAASQETGRSFPWDTRHTTDVQITPVGNTPVAVIVFGAQNSLIDVSVDAVFCASPDNSQAAIFYQRYLVGNQTLWETIRLNPGQCKVLNIINLHLRRSSTAIVGTFTLM